MDTKNDQPTKKHITEWPWAAIVLVVGWIGFWISYSSGDAYYRAFLSHFSVEAEGFPIDQYRHFVLSAFGGLNFITVVGNWVHKNRSLFGGLLAVYILLMMIAVVVTLLTDGKENKAAKYVTGRPVLRVIRDVVIAWYVFPVSLLFMSAALVVGATLPAAFAEAGGNAVAESSLADYKKGCEKSAEKCQVLLKNGSEVARGYVIAQSPTRIAIYFDDSTVQMPLDGIEMRTVQKPSSTQLPH
ncbi:hypothetical protein [Burkholderia orbicola]|uniref:hypothetical protein n=1 Tax=Burkholderia orbicola TaxID=2978683 RepID=UPI0026509C62|nr:hypothetical protein [Burkholderia orbicola]MDN7561090.1 hypothetical protein [Burkholderia orbicola]